MKLKTSLLSLCAMAVLASLFSVGCSTKHNTALSRGYQRLTSHYNVYFNAKEAYEAGLDNIRKAYVNDYSHVLPVYEFSSLQAASAGSGDLETTLKKCHKLIQLHSITVKPEAKTNMTEEDRRFRAKDEYNPYVPEAYLLIGKANIVRHEEAEANKVFDYLTLKHETERPAYECKIWKAIAYTQLGQYNNAVAALKSYDMDGVAPSALFADYQAAYANVFIAQGLYAEAIPYVEKAVENMRDRVFRRRLTYILAQLYRATGDKAKAAPLFLKLSRGMQDFDMAFAAKLDLGTVATTPEELAQAEKTLLKMAADPKYEDNLDQVYYAIGNMELNKGHRNAAIANFDKSVETSVSNDNQKGLSFLALADIYQAEPRYIEASMSLDSAAFFLSTDNDRKAEVDERSALLAPLAVELRTVRDNDSIMRLANMSQSERDAVINQMLKEDAAKREAAQLAREAEQENSMSQNDFYQMNRGQKQSGSSGNAWYFYNNAIVSAGKSTFRTKWGRRKNEDNWRRADKGQNMASESSDDSADAASADAISPDGVAAELSADASQSGPLSREGLMAGLPLSPEKQKEVEAKTADALLAGAQILYNDVHDYASSAALLAEFCRRFPSSASALDALTLLHFAQDRVGDRAGMAKTDSEILSRFPESMMAQNLKNPAYLASLAAGHDAQEAAYAGAYASYLNADFNQAIGASSSALSEQATEEHYKPRYLLVRALSYAKLANSSNFRADLEAIHSRYAGTEQDSVATLLLAELDKGRQPVRHIDYRSPLAEEGSAQSVHAAQKAQYVYEPDSAHVVVCFVDFGKLKEAQFRVADYNFSYYILRDFDLAMKNIPGEKQAIIISSFANVKEASNYLYAIRDQAMWKALSSAPLPEIYIMSVSNYRLMSVTGTDDAFRDFYNENYKK